MVSYYYLHVTNFCFHLGFSIHNILIVVSIGLLVVFIFVADKLKLLKFKVLDAVKFLKGKCLKCIPRLKYMKTCCYVLILFFICDQFSFFLSFFLFGEITLLYESISLFSKRK